MAFDFLESLNSILGGSVAGQLSNSLGESEGGVRKTLAMVGPLVLAGLIRRTAAPSGASDVLGMLKDDRINPSIVGRLQNLAADGGLDSLRVIGRSLGTSIFGNRLEGVGASLGAVSGVRPASAMSLLSLALPIVLGLVRKHVAANGLNLASLNSFLSSQRAPLERRGLDSRITSAMGYANLSALLGLTTAARNGSRNGAVHGRKSGASWWPWAAAAVLAVAVLLFTLNPGGSRNETVSITPSEDSTPASSAVQSASTQVYFATGETKIDTDDRQRIAGIARAARGQGKDVRVTGYTDQRGDHDQNVQIAMNRALAVKKQLMSEGVSESHIVMDPPATVTGSSASAESRRVDVVLR